MTPSSNPSPGLPTEPGLNRSRETREVDAMKLPTIERWRRALRAFSILIVNPNRTDMVLEFGIHVNAGTMARRVSLFYNDPGGRRLYQERRTLDSKTVDLNGLGQLPEGSLGRAYADFMRGHGITPEIFDGSPEQLSEPQAAYFVQRMRQTHDMWHVVTGYETDPLGEVLLQAFTYGQLQPPSSLLIALSGTLRGLSKRLTFPREMLAAYRAGRSAGTLSTFPWEDYMEMPLSTVRERLGIAGPA